MKNPKDSKKLLHSRAGNFWQRIRALWDRYSNEADHSKGWLDTGLRRRHRLNWIFGSIVALGFILFFGILIWLKNAGIMQIDESRLLLIIDYKHADNTLVFDRRGEKIGEFFSDYHVYIPYEKIPTQLVKAVISIEDRHYFEHHGIDMRGIVRALLASLRSGGFTQGGSTITQQVVRNFLLSPEKKFERKIKEALLALELEQHLSKEKILEIYLNALFLGQGAYGVGAAAERHFGRPLAELETHELALIAGLFQSPSRYNPHKSPEQAKRRQRQVLKAMVQNGYLSQADYKKARSKPLIYKSQNQLNTAFAPNFIDAVQELTEKLLTGEVKGKGLRIYTTLDLSLQQDMNEVIKESTPIFSAAAHKLVNVKNPNENMIEAASIILDHSNGDVLAMTGGRDYARSQFNRALKAKRAPGSSFKPAVYAAALMGGSKWSDQVYVSPIMIQDYRPANYADEFLSEATLYSAFYQSINTPVVELGYL
ncbi:MAG: transglycosylase domain-containing protein, partial [Proteobacteria bacterium]|nr:transglycosylase domain-containing protein [Pseudomonadota bacterium]